MVALVSLILMMSTMGMIPPPTEKPCRAIQEHFGNSSNTTRSHFQGLLGGGGGVGGRKRSLDPFARYIRQSDEYIQVEFNNESNIDILVDDMEGEKLQDRSWLYTASSLSSLFAGYMALFIIGEMLTSPTGSLADTATLYSLGKDDLTYYGHQRACAAIAHILSCFPAVAILKLSHLVMYRCDITLDFFHYKILFFIFDGWMIMTILIVYFKFDYGDDKKTSTYNPKGLFKMLTSAHYGSILAIAFYFGTCNGLIHGFFFGHMRDLGADDTLLGVATFILYGSEVLMFFLAHTMIKMLGYIWVMYFGLGCYVVRFLMYALITNPWGLIPAEILQGVSYAAVWASMTTYMAKGVSSDNYATVLGLLHAMYWGLGNGVGNFVGGAMIDDLGAKYTFWVFCILSALILALFAFIQRMYPEGPTFVGDYSEIEGETLIGDTQPTLYTSPPDNDFGHAMLDTEEAPPPMEEAKMMLKQTDSELQEDPAADEKQDNPFAEDTSPAAVTQEEPEEEEEVEEEDSPAEESDDNV
uniref:Major facilitator superfamily domain-containing protein 6-like n=1 Tax=Saccoglossus kowalevskii TaxID=10224 RepID=A0ABM0GSB0_SACKO|nr:PREDICTED: major facilitator superfamily domain-containing protein 6-like [Saccoglossus kowalevskii]